MPSRRCKKKGIKLEKGESPDLKVKAAKPYLDAALRLFSNVANSSSDRAAKARNYEVSLKVLRQGTDALIDDLKTFDECYLKAKYETAKYQETIGKLIENYAALRKTHKSVGLSVWILDPNELNKLPGGLKSQVQSHDKALQEHKGNLEKFEQFLAEREKYIDNRSKRAQLVVKSLNDVSKQLKKKRQSLDESSEAIRKELKTGHKDLELRLRSHESLLTTYESLLMARQKLLDDRSTHVRLLQAAYRKAIRLSDPIRNAREVAEGRFYLSYIYFLLGDPYRSAVLGEYLVRQEPPQEKAADAATYALQSYVTILDKFDNYGNMDQLREFVEFLLEKRSEQWKGKPVLAQARYQLALTYSRDKRLEGKRFTKTVDILKDLPENFRLYILSKCQMARFALLAKRTEAKTAKEKAELEKLAIQAFESVKGKLPDNADPYTVQYYLDSEREYGGMLYRQAYQFLKAKQYDEANKTYVKVTELAETLQKEFNKHANKINVKNRGLLENGLAELEKFGRFGSANIEFQDGHYDNVLSERLTGKVVKEISEKAKATEGMPDNSIVVADFKISGSMLGLALRANVLKGNTKAAQDLLDMMIRIKGGGFDNNKIMITLIGDMQRQVDALSAENKTDEMKAVLKKFTTFLEAVSKKKGVDLGKKDRIFLAGAHSRLGDHERAAKLLSEEERPTESSEEKELKVKLKAELKNLNSVVNIEVGEKKKKAQDRIGQITQQLNEMDNNAERNLQSYWMIRVMYAEELRKTGKLKEALKVVYEPYTDESSKVKIAAHEALIHIYEDSGKWGTAITEWGKLLRAVQPQMATNMKMQKMFYNGYVSMTRDFYELSQSKGVKGTAKERAYIAQAAKYMIRVESPIQKLILAGKKVNAGKIWQPVMQRLVELRKENPELNKAYEAEKKK